MKRKDKSTGSIRDDRKRNDALNKAGNKSGEQGEERKLPGNYPPQEDIMNRRDTERVGLDVDNFSGVLGHENLNKDQEPVVTRRNEILSPLADFDEIGDVEQPPSDMERPVPKNLQRDEDDIDFTAGNESDVTREDLEALGPKDLSMDMGEDEQLKNRVWPVDMAGDDLDIPGAELDDSNEAMGDEDEENNSYSIGGDRHEDNLEGK